MRRILITGMSGTGKSTVIRELQARGHRAIDTDYDGWSRWVDMETGAPAEPPAPGEYGWDRLDWAWDEERMAALLAEESGDALFVSGTSPNQGKFYPQFDHIILLSAPVEVMMERLASRTNNPYGKSPDELARVVEQKDSNEPLLRKRATLEIDASATLDKTLAAVLRFVAM